MTMIQFRAQHKIAVINTPETVYAAGEDNTVGKACYVVNDSGSLQTVKVAVLPSGDTLGAEHYVYVDASVPANSTMQLDLSGIPLFTGDSIVAEATSTDIVFFVSGVRINPAL